MGPICLCPQAAGRGRGSVQEALAGLLPAAGGAPLVPVLNAVHLAALFSFPAGFPGGALGPRWRRDDQVRLHGRRRLLGLAEA